MLEVGKWTVRATHSGRGNFSVSLRPAEAGGIPMLAFNEIGPGAWEWSALIEKPGAYYLDVVFADGAWTLSAE